MLATVDFNFPRLVRSGRIRLAVGYDLRACSGLDERVRLAEVRSPQEDIEIIRMYAKARHQPRRTLHRLADALERERRRRVKKLYDRLVDEVEATLPKYPDILGTLDALSETPKYPEILGSV